MVFETVMDKTKRYYLYKKLAFLFFYLLVVFVMNRLGVTCIFKFFTGIDCPGCGLTRAALSLLEGDLRAAAGYNVMVFSLPLLLVYYFTDGRLFGKKADAAVIGAVALGFLVNWLFRKL